MSKRFIYELHGTCFRDNGVRLSTKEVLDLLNKLNEENEQLKSDKNDLITALFKSIDEKQKLQSEIQDFQELLTQKDNVCYERVIKLIDEKIEIADTYRTPIKSVRYGDDLGYWNGVYQSMKELKKELKR